MISLRDLFLTEDRAVITEDLAAKGYLYQPYRELFKSKEFKKYYDNYALNNLMRVGSDVWYVELDPLETCCFTYGDATNDFYPLGIILEREKAVHIIRYIKEHHPQSITTFCKGLAIPKFEELFAKDFTELYTLACQYPVVGNPITLKVWLRSREQPLQNVNLESMYAHYYAPMSVTARFNLVLKTNKLLKISEFIGSNKYINPVEISTEYISTPDILELVVKKFGYYMDKKQLAISVIKHNNIPLLDRLLKIYPEILNYTSLDEIKRTKEEENIGVKIVNINYSYMYAAITTNNPRIVQMVQERINTKNQELAPNLFKEKTKSLGIAAARMTRVTSLIIKDDDPDIMFYALEGGNKELLGDRKFQVTYKHILQAIKGDNDEIVTDVLSRAGDVKVNPMVILQNVMTKSLSVIRVVVLWLRQKYDLTIDQIHYINTYCVNGFPYSDYDKEKIDIVLNNTTHDGSNSDITNLLSNLARNKENSPDILEFISERFNVSETDWRQVNDAAESVLNYKISWYLADKI